MTRIVTSHDYPPIPDRSVDWSAYVDGWEEDGPYGRGPTEMLALKRLADELLEDTPPEAIHALGAFLRLHAKDLRSQGLESEAHTTELSAEMLERVFG